MKYGWCDCAELNLSFYLFLINLNNYTRLVDLVLDSSGVGSDVTESSMTASTSPVLMQNY